MRECKIDDVCHNVLNYVPVIKGMIIDIERAIEAELDPEEILEKTSRVKHRCENIEQFLKAIIGNGESKRETVISVAWSYLGTPYLWGGDDPAGFDCSGYIIESLKSVGLLPRKGDWTADTLYHRFVDLEIETPVRGALVFWFNSAGKAVHIELCLNDTLAIGASGGGPLVKTLNDAMRENAFIKVRPLNSRPGIRRYIDPF